MQKRRFHSQNAGFEMSAPIGIGVSLNRRKSLPGYSHNWPLELLMMLPSQNGHYQSRRHRWRNL
jgi:hypothetical protein